jgi:hypothetical protein
MAELFGIGILVGVGRQWSMGKWKDFDQAYITDKGSRHGLAVQILGIIGPWFETMRPDAYGD